MIIWPYINHFFISTVVYGLINTYDIKCHCRLSVNYYNFNVDIGKS